MSSEGFRLERSQPAITELTVFLYFFFFEGFFFFILNGRIQFQPQRLHSSQPRAWEQ